MQILPRPSMLSLLRLRSSVVATTTTTTTTTTTSSSTAQYYAASALPRHLPAVLWRPPAPARRASPHPLPPDPPAPRLFRRYPNGSRGMATTSASGIKGDSDDTMAEADNGERDGRRTAAHNGDGDKHTRKKKIVLLCGDGPPGEFSDDEEFIRLEAQQLEPQQLEQYYNSYPPDQDVDHMHIFPYSTHRDGSVYRGIYLWKKAYRIANRNETRIEPMMLSDPKDCMFITGRQTCGMHYPRHMLQILSLKLAKIDVDGGPIELYGYMAARDVLEPLLNYVLNVSRNDPIVVEQGSLIEMTGPKRGIELCDTTLIEYDMRIKMDGEEEDDLQLIDGVSLVDERTTASAYAFTKRIHGDCGAVDITVSRLDFAVEATIEIRISEVGSNFNLCVGCFTSGLCEEIQLFKGAISEPRALRRCVVAAVIDTWMDVKLKVGSGPSYSSDNTEHWCTFKTTNHGWSGQQIKVEFASILVKVTWSTLSFMSGF